MFCPLFISVGSWCCLCTEHVGSVIAIMLIRSPTKATLQGYNLHIWVKCTRNVMRAYAKWPFKTDSCSSWVFLCRPSRQFSRNVYKLVGFNCVQRLHSHTSNARLLTCIAVKRKKKHKYTKEDEDVYFAVV